MVLLLNMFKATAHRTETMPIGHFFIIYFVPTSTPTGARTRQDLDKHGSRARVRVRVLLGSIIC
jgi:hypothetical protein